MDFLTDWLTDWLKELLISGIMGNLSGLFDNVNAQVGEIAVQVGTTPAAWHAGVFSLIRQLSETVILPIAGMVLTFVATYELIQMLLEKNNMHEFDVANIYKWMFKTSCAILILSNTFNIVMAVFDVSQSVIAQSAGLIQGSTDITPDMLTQLETTLEGMDLGPLLGLWLQSSIIGVTMWALNIIIFVLVYGRMIEIYLLTSLSPIPVATLANRELGHTGQNICARCSPWDSRGCSFWCAWQFTRCLSRGSPQAEIPSGRYGAPLAIRYCFAICCSKRAVSPSAFSARIRGEARMAEHSTLGQNVPKSPAPPEGLFLMDGIEGLRSLPQHSVDMLLTDPPYGTTRNFWDVPLPLPELWEAVRWAVKPEGAVLFFAQCPYDKVLGASNLPMLRYEWVWYKSRCTGFLNARRAPLKRTENILVFYQKLPYYDPQFEQGKPYKKTADRGGNSPNYGKFVRSGGGSEDGLRFPGNLLTFPSVQRTVHPTQKPVELCEYFIKTYTRPGEVVADICAGSGTTAVAAVNTGRRFICFETAPAFYAPATERIRLAQAAAEAGEKGV